MQDKPRSAAAAVTAAGGGGQQGRHAVTGWHVGLKCRQWGMHTTIPAVLRESGGGTAGVLSNGSWSLATAMLRPPLSTKQIGLGLDTLLQGLGVSAAVLPLSGWGGLRLACIC